MFLSRAKNMSAEKNESPQKIRAIIYALLPNNCNYNCFVEDYSLD